MRLPDVVATSYGIDRDNVYTTAVQAITSASLNNATTGDGTALAAGLYFVELVVDNRSAARVYVIYGATGTGTTNVEVVEPDEIMRELLVGLGVVALQIHSRATTVAGQVRVKAKFLRGSD